MNKQEHPSFGLVTPEMMAGALAAPAGKAREIIRKVYPAFGIREGEKIKFRATITRDVVQVATKVVEAHSEEDAQEILEDMDENDFDFEDDEVEPFSIETVEII